MYKMEIISYFPTISLQVKQFRQETMMLQLLILCVVVGTSWGVEYAPNRCPTLLHEWERIDCHPEPGASEASCESRGCTWCRSNTYGLPWCFYNYKPGYDVNSDCSQAVPDAYRIDCQNSGKEVNNANCADAGCIYCPSDKEGLPWCFYDIYDDTCDADIPPETARVDCHPGPGASLLSCHAKGCAWCKSNTEGVPWCFFKPDSKGYNIISQTESSTGYVVTLQRDTSPHSYSEPIDFVKVEVEFQGNERLRVKITDADVSRFEVKDFVTIRGEPQEPTNPMYEVTFSDTPRFSFKVTRRSNGETIFDSSLGGFVFEDQFIQINTKLPPGGSVYGLGETEHHSLKHKLEDWKKYSMYARDNPPWGDINIYGTLPFYMALDKDNLAHGVLFLNSNAMEVDLSPDPYLTFRTIGGIIDLYFFMGPTPESVVQQYTGAVGRPYFPPYWSLGYQLCRYGYNSISTLKETIDRTRAAGIPYDVQYGDIDYMDQERDFTYDQVNFAGLPELVDELHSDGMKYVIILDPCIDITLGPGNYPAFDNGDKLNIWVTKGDGVTPAPAKVWPPGTCYFPDFTNNKTEDWWITECVNFWNTINYDGLWIDMNEPANFVKGYYDEEEIVDRCPNNIWNNPPYKPRTLGMALAEKSLCPDAIQKYGRHYDLHSLYGYSQSVQTLPAVRAATGKRGIVFSRSTYPGSGHYGGHWLGDNFSQWTNLHYSIIGIIADPSEGNSCNDPNIFLDPKYSSEKAVELLQHINCLCGTYEVPNISRGDKEVGPDICGFGGTSTAEMCQRWQQLGAFYTFSRNHNALYEPEQDPASFGDEVARVTREALEIRYQLLPYLYTLFHHAHVEGSTVMRPLFHEFVDDVNTHAVDKQFLWGPAFLISPVLTENTYEVDAYFPNARWYAWESGVELHPSLRGTTVKIPAPLDFIPLHIRGGYILPMQDHAVTTTASRKNDMGLIIALDENESARGDLFWDDGDSIDTYEKNNYLQLSFDADRNSVMTTVMYDGYEDASQLKWGTIKVFGLSSCSRILVNEEPHSDYVYDSGNGVLVINNISSGVAKPITSPLTVTWN